jgi:arsenate reductase
MNSEEKKPNKEKRILFISPSNAGRSQMAAAIAISLGFNYVESAGTIPAQAIYPTVIGAMKEKGIDVSRNTPRLLTPEMIDRAELIVTMGASIEQLVPRSLFPELQKRLVLWDLKETKGRSINEVRKIRDEIELRLKQLAQS